jgi:hypothetical protein
MHEITEAGYKLHYRHWVNILSPVQHSETDIFRLQVKRMDQE